MQFKFGSYLLHEMIDRCGVIPNDQSRIPQFCDCRESCRIENCMDTAAWKADFARHIMERLICHNTGRIPIF